MRSCQCCIGSERIDRTSAACRQCQVLPCELIARTRGAVRMKKDRQFYVTSRPTSRAPSTSATQDDEARFRLAAGTASTHVSETLTWCVEKPTPFDVFTRVGDLVRGSRRTSQTHTPTRTKCASHTHHKKTRVYLSGMCACVCRAPQRSWITIRQVFVLLSCLMVTALCCSS